VQPGEGFLHWSFECAEEYFVSFLMMCTVCCAHSLAESPKGINGVMLGPEVFFFWGGGGQILKTLVFAKNSHFLFSIRLVI
jgi:hypothetical protein